MKKELCLINPIGIELLFGCREVKSGRLKSALIQYYKDNSEFRDSINSVHGINNKLCNWGCNTLNYRLENIEFNVTENVITILEVKYSNIHYCGSFECKEKYKLYNANSAYKVMLNHNLDNEDDARLWIRTNNPSPFYKENHKSTADYKESQRRNQNPDKWREMTEKASFSRSLSGYIRRYGEDIGTKKFQEYCKSKGHTLENFVQKYGDIDGIEKFNNLITNKVRNNGSYFGIISYTKKNERLLSSLEKLFYDYICQYDLEDFYEVGVYYGGKYGFKSDFYFPILDLHIEIAGMMQHKDYRDKMKLKKDLYKDKCLIVLPENIETTIKGLKNKINEACNEK